MFKFRFSSEGNSSPEISDSEESKETVEVKESRELKFDELDKIEERLRSCSLIYKELYGILRYISNDDEILTLLKTEESSEVLKAEVRHSDLLPGIYEGGCKIWEGTYDVIKYIQKEEIDFKSKKVLDLGCGVGLIGITCATRGASSYFQDYNDEVLKYFTHPNVAANKDNIPQFNRNMFKYFCGDWTSFVELWQKAYNTEKKFDYIFTCETIYNRASYKKLHSVFENLLSPQGIVYLAAKVHYFGPGGGLFEFKKLLEKKKIFKYTTVWEHTNGLRREILEIKFNETQ